MRKISVAETEKLRTRSMNFDHLNCHLMQHTVPCSHSA